MEPALAAINTAYNQVSVITSTAERQAATEFARAAAMRPQIVGAALRKISRDLDIAQALFQVLETEKLVEGEADVTLIPSGSADGLFVPLLAAREHPARPPIVAAPGPAKADGPGSH